MRIGRWVIYWDPVGFWRRPFYREWIGPSEPFDLALKWGPLDVLRYRR